MAACPKTGPDCYSEGICAGGGMRRHWRKPLNEDLLRSSKMAIKLICAGYAPDHKLTTFQDLKRRPQTQWIASN